MAERQSDDRDVAAGAFSTWLAGMEHALRGDGESEVPCGSCTACCTSSQFVHIAPGEVDTLSHIPKSLLFDAPLMPRGHVLMGYDERGHCPMLVDGCCSIYEHRPQTCRTYDCRIFPATGLAPDDSGHVLIAARASRWRFDYPTDTDSSAHAAVQAAAGYLRDHRVDFAEGEVPRNPTQLAALAIELHDLFLRPTTPDPASVRVELRRRTNSDSR